MCRWFAYLSATEPCLLEDVLINADHALTKQVHDHYLPGLLPHDPTDLYDTPDKLIRMRNVLYNMAGLGIGWYTSTRESYVDGVTGQRPACYKTVLPPATDYNVRSLCANIEARALFAHIRAGAPPYAQPNNHPFVFGRHMFMHNGDLMSYANISRRVHDLIGAEPYARIKGSTDSEGMAALYMTFLTGNGASAETWEEEYSVERMRDALRQTVVTVIGLSKHMLPSDKFVPSSLNLAVTDGKRLVACRFRNHKTQEPPSLYYSTTAGVKLNRKYRGGDADQYGTLAADQHGKHVIVSSEPSTYEEHEWSLIEKNSLLVVDSDSSVRLEKITYDPNFDAEQGDSVN